MHASPILPKRDQKASDGQVVTAAEAAKVPFGLGTLPLPSLDPHSSNSTCRFLTNNLWSDIKGLQAPDEPGDPNVPVQTYSGPTAAPSDCEGFAYLVFKNAGTIGNTQTLILPANKNYMLSYAMAPSTVRLKSVTVYAAPPPPSAMPYGSYTIPIPDFNKDQGQNGTMPFVTPATKDGAPTMNTHLMLEFSGPGAQGTLGLFGGSALPTPPPVDSSTTWSLNLPGSSAVLSAWIIFKDIQALVGG